ncbi:MAG: hypothetical protein M0P71_05015 [Melioribacteraceae bacterium]|nr:hypothetical protein [Melioribacteraceae bacterium]
MKQEIEVTNNIDPESLPESLLFGSSRVIRELIYSTCEIVINRSASFQTYPKEKLDLIYYKTITEIVEKAEPKELP